MGTGPSMNRDRQIEPGPCYQSYRNEIRRERAMFPWWNHWPTADIPSDGRWAQAADRPAHSSLVMGTEWEDLEATPTRRSRVMLHGLTEASAAGLAPLARSWLQPPEVRVKSGRLQALGFDKLQRLFRFRLDGPGHDTAEVVFDASLDRPLQGLAIAVEGWTAAEVAVSVSPATAIHLRMLRTARVRSLDGDTLLVWLPLTSSTPLTVSLGPR